VKNIPLLSVISNAALIPGDLFVGESDNNKYLAIAVSGKSDECQAVVLKGDALKFGRVKSVECHLVATFSPEFSVQICPDLKTWEFATSARDEEPCLVTDGLTHFIRIPQRNGFRFINLGTGNITDRILGNVVYPRDWQIMVPDGLDSYHVLYDNLKDCVGP
jgi:hypothetical protein